MDKRRNTWHLLAFGLCMALYLGFPAYQLFSYEQVLDKGSVYRFEPMPLDPFNPFTGRYLAMNFPSQKVQYEAEDVSLMTGNKVYVRFAPDSTGFARAIAVTTQPPEGTDYLAVQVSSQGSEADAAWVSFDLPFDRYYLNEKLAPAAEDAYREYTGADDGDSPEQSIYAEVRIYRGMAVIEEVYLDGQPLVPFLKARAAD